MKKKIDITLGEDFQKSHPEQNRHPKAKLQQQLYLITDPEPITAGEFDAIPFRKELPEIDKAEQAALIKAFTIKTDEATKIDQMMKAQ